MTLDEFFRRVRSLKLVWMLDEKGRVRVREADSVDGNGRPKRYVDSCPLNKVAGSSGTGFPYYHGRKLGLSRSDVKRVWEAEDKADAPHRKRLLLACGIEERK